MIGWIGLHWIGLWLDCGWLYWTTSELVGMSYLMTRTKPYCTARVFFIVTFVFFYFSQGHGEGSQYTDLMVMTKGNEMVECERGDGREVKESKGTNS